MLKRNYSPGFSGATIAAGGALKALIPPSLSMILYCVVARTYIFDVFIAAVIPALITIAANIVAIALVVRLNPSIAPVAEQVSRAEKLTALWRASPAILLIGIIFVGLYSGIFTVSEAASVAAVVSFVFALMRRTITPANFVIGLRSTALIAGMIYFVLIGSSIFTYFISLAKIPEQLIAFLGGVNLPPIGIIVLMLAAYLVLGAVFDELAAMIVTLPFALPVIVHFGYDPVWWAIINVIIVELGLVIPPIGLVILIINAMRPDIPLQTLYRSITSLRDRGPRRACLADGLSRACALAAGAVAWLAWRRAMDLPQANLDPEFRITRTSHVVLTVKDLAASRDFYTEVIGLVVTAEEDDTLYLRGVEEACHHSLVLRKGSEPSCARIGMRIFTERDLEKAKAVFDCKGAPTAWVEVPHQGRTLHVTDPVGTPLEFCASMPVVPRMITNFTRSTTAAARCGSTTIRS